MIMDATSLLERLNSGELTPAQAVADAFSKIETINPKRNAVTEMLKADALQQVQQLPDGPLKGLPISIKECYAIKGKTIRSGSLRMKPVACSEDAAVVKKLKAAGAIVVARGNTSEFLLGRETDNLVYGTTNNVYDASLTAGGSSGGDGVLTATECVAFGIGTDIGGSCRYPALFNGIVGFKPASGQIDKTGIFPSAGNAFTESMNSPGVLARSVRDVRLVYNVIGDKQLTASGDTGSLRILTCPDFDLEIKEACITDAFNSALDFFRAAAIPMETIAIPESGTLYKTFATLMGAGFTDKIYEWSITEDGRKLSFFGELFRRMRGQPTISNELFSMLLPFNIIKPSAGKLAKTIETVSQLRGQYAAKLNKSVLVLPTAGILSPPHRKFISMYSKPGIIRVLTPVSFCNILNLSCITIPAKKFQKSASIHPPAVQLVAAPGNEALLLDAAELLEGALN